MLDLVRDMKVPTIALAMGETGFFTRILGAKFGSPFTYCGFNPDRTFAPGMPVFRDICRDYFTTRSIADTKVYAVIGDPIGHSLSPAVHNTAFRHLKINSVMVPLKIPAGHLKECLEALEFLKLQGISVTIPHKEAVISLLSKTDRAVEMTGACNTMVINEDGGWVGP